MPKKRKIRIIKKGDEKISSYLRDINDEMPPLKTAIKVDGASFGNVIFNNKIIGMDVGVDFGKDTHNNIVSNLETRGVRKPIVNRGKANVIKDIDAEK